MWVCVCVSETERVCVRERVSVCVSVCVLRTHPLTTRPAAAPALTQRGQLLGQLLSPTSPFSAARHMSRLERDYSEDDSGDGDPLLRGEGLEQGAGNADALAVRASKETLAREPARKQLRGLRA